MTRDEVIAALVKAGARRDQASFFADAFLDYVTASENLEQFGPIVKNPRSGAPQENPFLKVRERSFKQLSRLANVKGAGKLWEDYQNAERKRATAEADGAKTAAGAASEE